MEIIMAIVAFIAVCVIIYIIGFWAFLLVACAIALVVGMLYLWREVEYLKEDFIDLEEDFSQKLVYLNSESSKTKNLVNILKSDYSDTKKIINTLKSEYVNTRKSVHTLKSEYTSAYANTEKSINNLNSENLKLQKEIKHLKSISLDEEVRIKNLELDLETVVSNVQKTVREQTRKKLLTNKIKRHRETLILSLKKSLKDDNIEIKLLPNYQQYQISNKLDKSLTNFKALLSSFNNESIIFKDDNSQVILFTPITQEVDKIIQHANKKYGDNCGIRNGKYQEKFDDFIKHINSI